VAGALTVLERLAPDVLVVDVRLPDGDGIVMAAQAGNIYDKLGAGNRAQTVMAAVRWGLIHPGDQAGKGTSMGRRAR
jgi:DNA-binding NarL/FixJ family response regulator